MRPVKHDIFGSYMPLHFYRNESVGLWILEDVTAFSWRIVYYSDNDEMLRCDGWCGRSTKGASRQRRSLINSEILTLRQLLPVSDCARQRLSQLQTMSLTCIFIRKYQLLGASRESVHSLVAAVVSSSAPTT